MKAVDLSVFKNAIIVEPLIGSTTGKRKLTGDDLLGVTSTDFPQEVVDFGAKQVIDPECLKTFNTCRMQVRRILLRGGTRRFGGYMMKESDAENAINLISSIEQKFNAAKQALKQSLSDMTETWANQFPTWKDRILKASLTAEELDKRLSFQIQVYRLNLDTDHDAKSTSLGAALTKTLQEQLGGTEFRVLDEIRTEITESFKGKTDRTTSKVRSLLVRIKEKLEALSWVSPRLAHMGGWLQSLLDELPKTGAIEGGNYLKLIAILNLLQTPEKAMELANDQRIFSDIAIPLPILPVEPIEDIDVDDQDEEIDSSLMVHSQQPVEATADVGAFYW
jgi:hypothetical protein